jgi:hypothetical protein
MGVQIELVKGDDWEGLYVSGNLVCEDRAISIEEVMSHVLYQHVDRFVIYHADTDWVAETGSYPRLLQDVLLDSGKTIRETWETE